MVCSQQLSDLLPVHFAEDLSLRYLDADSAPIRRPFEKRRGES